MSQFLILLSHSKTLSFRALYIVHPQSGQLIKVYGKGPKILAEKYIEEYFKYDSTGRCFAKLSSKALTATTDAVSVDIQKLLRK